MEPPGQSSPAVVSGVVSGRLVPSGSGTATGIDSASGSGRACWCGGHGPCTGCAATFRYSTSCGKAHTVGLVPVFGAFSINSYNRGLPLLCPLDSTVMIDALSLETAHTAPSPVVGILRLS